MRSGRSTTELHPRVAEGDSKFIVLFIGGGCLIQMSFSAQLPEVQRRAALWNVIQERLPVKIEDVPATIKNLIALILCQWIGLGNKLKNF